jgi:hypothetical protein
MIQLLVALAVGIALVPVEDASIEARKLVLRAGGVTRTVPSKRDAIEALLSPNRHVVAVVRGTHDGGRVAKQELEVVSVRGDDIVVKHVDTRMPFVRDVVFLDDRRLVADVGGLHFAGVLILVDPQTGSVKERFSVAAGGARPEWAATYERLRSVQTE